MDKKRKKSVYATDSPAKTKKIGELLAKKVMENGGRGRARVLLLRGDLGAGKTQFIQGFAKGLGIKETVNSPTFTIMKKYALAGRGGFNHFYHIDCYRLNSGRDLKELGIGAILEAPGNIVALEWPAVAEEGVLFTEPMEIEFTVSGENTREITIVESDKPNEK